mmetsp:Transcript_34767/g.98547  ORF Transcript_34767/g.98547 Transcript_34767/m.98547 type:complete len:258 (-) Transcript_34767:1439-2212(-)
MRWDHKALRPPPRLARSGGCGRCCCSGSGACSSRRARSSRGAVWWRGVPHRREVAVLVAEGGVVRVATGHQREAGPAGADGVEGGGAGVWRPGRAGDNGTRRLPAHAARGTPPLGADAAETNHGICRCVARQDAHLRVPSGANLVDPLLAVGGPAEGAARVGAHGAAGVGAATLRGAALALPAGRPDLRPGEAPRLHGVFVLETRPAQPLARRDGGHPIAALVHADVAALAKDDEVGRLAVALAAHHADRVLVVLAG